ncbi:MAG: CCA tRNA nucleotidyltransferase [Chloroflexi bacterium]|nr:CCA tRNA nucleotidyltransferase [Chloroflexota bacterium]
MRKIRHTNNDELAKKAGQPLFGSFIKPEAASLLARVRNLLAEQGVKSYLVGGFIRDTLLDRESADIDIAVDADALEVAVRLAGAIGGKYVPLNDVNRVARIVLPGQAWEIDLSTMRESIEQDLALRDFTVDAMAVDLDKIDLQHGIEKGGHPTAKPSDLIDPFGGWEDLQKKIIRAVSVTAFESDPVRLLRAVRLAFELGFAIEPETERQIRRYSSLINRVAGERVREELLRLLAVQGIGQLLPYLDETGLLTAIIPELAEAKGVEQPKEHYWDVFQHSLQTVSALEFVLRQGNWRYAGEEALAAVPWSQRLAQHFGEEVSHGSARGSLLKLAALLHDIAKPSAKAFDQNGRMRFLGHAGEGATTATAIMERLRFSAKEIKMVETIIEHHLRPGHMSQDGELPSHRAIYRYFRDTGETGIDILYLSLADHLAARGPNLHHDSWQEHAKMVHYVLTRYFERESVIAPPALVNGHDLINIFGMKPGPEIGELLEAVREAQAAGELTTREEALGYIKSRLSTSPNS